MEISSQQQVYTCDQEFDAVILNNELIYYFCELLFVQNQTCLIFTCMLLITLNKQNLHHKCINDPSHIQLKTDEIVTVLQNQYIYFQDQSTKYIYCFQNNCHIHLLYNCFHLLVCKITKYILKNYNEIYSNIKSSRIW